MWKNNSQQIIIIVESIRTHSTKSHKQSFVIPGNSVSTMTLLLSEKSIMSKFMQIWIFVANEKNFSFTLQRPHWAVYFSCFSTCEWPLNIDINLFKLAKAYSRVNKTVERIVDSEWKYSLPHYFEMQTEKKFPT